MEEKDYSKVKKKFDDYFVKRWNVLFERARFNLRRQEEGETAVEFTTVLYSLSKHCNYGSLREMIRDNIVIRIWDSALSQKLQLEADLTLDKAVTSVCQNEAVKQQ